MAKNVLHHQEPKFDVIFPKLTENMSDRLLETAITITPKASAPTEFSASESNHTDDCALGTLVNCFRHMAPRRLKDAW